MLELPSDISSNDVSQWLRNGWFIVQPKDEGPYVASLADVGSGSADVRDLGGQYIQVPFKELRAHWPRCGAINVGSVAVNIVRRQARQYRRTYNSRQVQMQIPRKWEALKLYGAEIRNYSPDHEDVLAALFFPEYQGYAQAAQDLRSGEAFSRAINPQIIIAGTEESTLVYYRGTLVGQISNDRLLPINSDASVLRRLLKYFEGRVSL